MDRPEHLPVRGRFSFAWFAGADLRLLAQTPSEWSFYNALGAAVFLLACGNGFSLCLAAGYMLGSSPARLWWLGCAWTVVLAAGVERLVLQLPPSRPRRWLLVALVPRAALSILIALQFGEALNLRINQDAIANQISIVQTASARTVRRGAASFYGARIAADRAQIAAIRRGETRLVNEVEHFTFLSSCEAAMPSCSTTHRLGCGPYCRHYGRVAENLRAQLAQVGPRDRARIRSLEADIEVQQALQRGEVTRRVRAIDQNNGLIAREEALTSIENAHPEVAGEVWFWRALFWALDLLPLGVKVLRLLATDSPYEALVAAARRRDAVATTRVDEASRVETELVHEQGRADEEFGRIRITLENERRIAEEEASTARSRGSWQEDPPRPSGSQRERVRAYSLGELMQEMRPHERERVPVDPRLARAGRIGSALVGVLTLGIVVFSALAQTTISGEWLVLAVFALVAALAGFTRWYATAPRWALRPIFATLLTGLVLPVVIIALNL